MRSPPVHLGRLDLILYMVEDIYLYMKQIINLDYTLREINGKDYRKPAVMICCIVFD